MCIAFLLWLSSLPGYNWTGQLQPTVWFSMLWAGPTEQTVSAQHYLVPIQVGLGHCSDSLGMLVALVFNPRKA